MKNPYHIYWGKERGVVVTRDPRGEETRPEIAFTSSAVSRSQLKTAAAILGAGLFIVLAVRHMVKKSRRYRAERRAAKANEE